MQRFPCTHASMFNCYERSARFEGNAAVRVSQTANWSALKPRKIADVCQNAALSVRNSPRTSCKQCERVHAEGKPRSVSALRSAHGMPVKLQRQQDSCGERAAFQGAQLLRLSAPITPAQRPVSSTALLIGAGARQNPALAATALTRLASGLKH